MKRLTPYLKGLLVLVLFFASQYVQWIPILLFRLDVKHLTGNEQIWLSLFQNVVLILVLVGLYWKDLKREWFIFKQDWSKNIDIGFKFWLLGLIGMVTSNLLINSFTPSTGPQNEQAVQSMIEVLPWVMLLNTGLLAPISEEITFRKTFKDAISNKWLCILLSGVIFGSLHVIFMYQSWSDLLYIIPYSSLGIAFAYIYQKTDTIFPCIFMHAFHNTVITLMSIL